MGKRKNKSPGRQRRGLMAPASADDCSPGSGWHVYNGQALGFKMGRRWVDWVFISPGATVHEANQLLAKLVIHIAFFDQGQYQDLGGAIVTQHAFQGGPDWFVLTLKKKKCSYICTSRDLRQAFGIDVRFTKD